MKYYKIYEPVSRRMYGTFPNFKSDIEETFYLPNSILKKPLFIGNDHDALVPKLFQHRKSSKVTDNLNGSIDGFGHTMIISKNMRRVIETCKVFEMTFFKTNYTTLDGYISDYYFLKPKKEALDCIEYGKTEFNEWQNVGPKFKNKERPLYFKNKLELLEYEKSGKANYEILKLVINEQWDYDLFALKMVEGIALCFIGSERLKQRIVQEGITGVGFLELNTSIPVI